MPGGTSSIPTYVHLRAAKDLIDRRYAEPLDVTRIAEEAFASPAHFSRSFKRAFGEPPHRYLLRRRIERAKKLLRETEISVTEVSLEVGFRGLGSFSTGFRTGRRHRAGTRGGGGRTGGLRSGCFALMHTRPVQSSSFG